MNNENIERSSNDADITILKEDKITTVNLFKYIKEIKSEIDGIIRIHKNDLWYFYNTSKYLTHFNLQYCEHKINHNYLLPKILKSGYFKKNEEEIKPILDFKLCLIGKCIKVVNNVSYEDLTKDDFEYSFANIKTIDELKEQIYKRYSASLPDLNKEEILNLGVSITKLEILGRNEKN